MNTILTIGADCYNILTLRGSERLSQPFVFLLSIITKESMQNITQYLLLPATLQIGESKIKGIITKATTKKLNQQQTNIMAIELKPRLALASLTTKTETYLGESAQDITVKTLAAVGYNKTQLPFKLIKEDEKQPYIIQQPEENDLEFIQRLLKKNNISFWFNHDKDFLETIIFTDNDSCFSHHTSHIPMNEISGGNNRKLLLRTARDNLHPGHVIVINSKKHLIVTVNHLAEKEINNLTFVSRQSYSNMILAIALDQFVLQEKQKQKPLPFLMVGHIHSDNSRPTLDFNGRYSYKLDADICSNKVKRGYIQAKRVLPCPAWHMPLDHNSEILISTLNNDDNRPVIIGTTPNANKKSPTTNSNPTENIISTLTGNSLIMDDKATQSSFKLQTDGGTNSLCLTQQDITLTTKLGAMNWVCRDNMLLNAQTQISEKSCARIINIPQNYRITTSHGSLLHQAKTFYNIYAKQNISYQSSQLICLNADAINLDAANHISLTAGKNHHFITRSGNTSVTAADNLMFNGRKEIIVRNRKAGITLNENSIDIYSHKLSILVQAGVSFKGKVNHIPTAPEAPVPPLLPTYRKAQEAQKLHIRNNSIYPSSQTLIIHLKDLFNSNKATSGSFLAGVVYHIESTETIKGTITNAKIAMNSLDLSKPFTFELIDQETDQLLYIIACNRTKITPQKKIKIMPSDIITTSNPNQASLALTILHPPIIFNLRQDANESPFIDKNISETCVENKKNLTLFIHGYNIPFSSRYGSYGKEIISIENSTGSSFAINSKNKETILRNRITLQRDFPSLIPWPKRISANLDSRKTLNGNGAHNWFTWIENNLNLATNRFEYKDYTNYTRLLNITWSGDPKYPYDYIEAMHETKNAGIKLGQILIGLAEKGIRVNIIAHSLGCGVVVNALEHLPENSIERVILWEAAIPNNFFDTSMKHKSDIWKLPNAPNAAKKITILYSLNDNILGPILPQQHDQTAINRSKPISELILALFLTHLDLHSIYELATWVGVPASSLLNQDLQEQIYSQWCRKHRSNHLAPTLAAEISKRKNDTIYLKLKQKLLETQNRINQELIKANHPIIAMALAAEEQIFEHLNWINLITPAPQAFNKILINTAMALPSIRGALELINIMLNSQQYNPTPAMGYSGPVNYQTFADKLTIVNQTEWLWDHSGMKIPTDGLMENIYKKYIINNENGIKGFG